MICRIITAAAQGLNDASPDPAIWASCAGKVPHRPPFALSSFARLPQFSTPACPGPGPGRKTQTDKKAGVNKDEKEGASPSKPIQLLLPSRTLFWRTSLGICPRHVCLSFLSFPAPLPFASQRPLFSPATWTAHTPASTTHDCCLPSLESFCTGNAHVRVAPGRTTAAAPAAPTAPTKDHKGPHTITHERRHSLSPLNVDQQTTTATSSSPQRRTPPCPALPSTRNNNYRLDSSTAPSLIPIYAPPSNSRIIHPPPLSLSHSPPLHTFRTEHATNLFCSCALSRLALDTHVRTLDPGDFASNQDRNISKQSKPSTQSKRSLTFDSGDIGHAHIHTRLARAAGPRKRESYDQSCASFYDDFLATTHDLTYLSLELSPSN